VTSTGLFVAFEGGEGSGKSTQTALLREWLQGQGRQVHVTHEPGDTAVGKQLREILLGHQTGELAARTEALLYAADRAEHVAAVVRPALHRGEIVITDRYIDSSLAYQGAGRALDLEDVEYLSAWATEALLPDLTIVLDIDPRVGLTRFSTPADRLEAEPLAFHQRVREQFIALAQRETQRYLVVDASAPAQAVHELVRTRLQDVLR
jgi:dTMP kinase